MVIKMTTAKMTTAKLIEVLKTKEQSAEIEFVIVQTDGVLVASFISTKAKAMLSFLKMFK